MSMEILAAGALTTVQDLGRRGYASHGVQENGACDKFNYQIANLLVGNIGKKRMGEVSPAVLEMTMKGAEILFTTQEIFALTGGDMKPSINGTPVKMYQPILVNPGDVLFLGTAVSGLRTYLAVYGGISLPLEMGSRSTSLKCHLGGMEGRAIQAGDVLNSGRGKKPPWKIDEKKIGCMPKVCLSSSGVRMMNGIGVPVLRVVLGPQEDFFTEAGIETFMHSSYELSSQSDRMACKLTGPVIETIHGADIISDGIVEGSVQVSSNGMPIVMLADHQTTGGYAKIATVIGADIPRLAQKKPGETVAFICVSPREAVEATREMAGRLQILEEWMGKEFGL